MFSLQKLLGKEDKFFTLLEASAEEARTSVQALVKLSKTLDKPLAVDEFAYTRQKDKQITREISAAVYTTFVTALEREDIEDLSNALYKIPKTIDKFTTRILLAPQHVRGMDFSKQINLLERATDIVLELVKSLRKGMDLEQVKDLNDKLQFLESEADTHMMSLYQDLFSGKHEPLQVIALKDLYELLEKVNRPLPGRRQCHRPHRPETFLRRHDAHPDRPVVALIFEYINGFHDTANAIATTVSTKVLTPRQAIVLSTVFNLLGALSGTAVASTIGQGLVDTHFVSATTLLAALLAAIAWNLLTWWLGLPSSSSHALIGGLCGATFASAASDWSVIKWSALESRHPQTGRAMAQGGWADVPFAGLRHYHRVRVHGAADGAAPKLESASYQGRVRPLPVAQRVLDELQPRHQRRAKDHGHHRADAFHGHDKDQRV